MSAADKHSGSDAISDDDARMQRIMKVVVGVLTLLILAGLGAVFTRIVYLASGGSAKPAVGAPAGVLPQAAADVPPAPGLGAQALPLPAGATIRAIALDGQRLAVHFDAPDGPGIEIVDLTTGRSLGRLKPTPAPAIRP